MCFVKISPTENTKKIFPPLSTCIFVHVFLSNSGREEFAWNRQNKDKRIAGDGDISDIEDEATCCLPLCKRYECLGPCDFLEAASRKRTPKKKSNDGFNRNLFFFAGVHFADAVLVFGCVAPANGVLWEEDFFLEYGMVSGCWVEFLRGV